MTSHRIPSPDTHLQERRLRDRRQWQRQTRESLIVALVSTPYGPSAARLGLELGRALIAPEDRDHRRTQKDVMLLELDFWAPTLASELQEPGQISRDMLSVFQELAARQELHDDLRRNQGLLYSSGDLERWAEELQPLLPGPVQDGEHLLIYPAADDAAAFERAKSFPPTRLVTYPAEPIALPGIAIWRTLLSAAVREQAAGMVLLSLAPGWNLSSLLWMGSLADVVIVLSSGERSEQAAIRPLVSFLGERRRSRTTRPEFENDLMVVVGRDDSADDGSTRDLSGDGFRERWQGELRGIARKDGRLETEALRSLARDLDMRAASKAAGGVELELVSDPEAADRALRAELAQHDEGARRLRILVEKGAYGEYPIKRLGETTRTVLTSLGEGGEGFALEPVPIGHDEFLEGLADPSSMRACFEEAGVELLTFPHYMLGALVEDGMLLPWHVLEDSLEAGAEVLEGQKIERWFYQVKEMCRFNGVLYAVPYSLLQKLILVKKGSDLLRSTHRWQGLRDRIDQEAGEGAGWPLLLETKLDHIGIWYDWREFVHAFGGADFQADPEKGYRGSDYGECWINHPRTVEATSFYLDLLSRTQHHVQVPIDWDVLLPLFLEDPANQLAIAWSDIVAYHWKRPSGEQRQELREEELPVGLEDKVEVRPFPSGHRGQTSIEGWVMAAPSWLAPERQRLVARLMSWFLSAPVQRRYAEHGGNTARRDVGHALSDVQRLVHRSILAPLKPPALKSTFREAPEMIQQIGRALKTWATQLLESDVLPDVDALAGQLDQLAREVTQGLLRNQARYRRPEYWRKLDEQKRS